jgi:hypothetical protein
MNPKKAYQKPEIREVELRAEEAVLTSCKTVATKSAQKGKCNAACSSKHNS